MSDRIHKFLSGLGYGSRREIEEWVVSGRLSVNGAPAEIGHKVGEEDAIKLDGRRLSLKTGNEPLRVLYYKKRTGEMVTRDDPEGRRTVFRKLPELETGRWIAVGRLDVNTSGLLLLTNHGELARRLMHPSFEQAREYAVRALGEVAPDAFDKLRNGVQLQDGTARFDSIRFGDNEIDTSEDEDDEGGGDAQGKGAGGRANHWFIVTLSEGRHREVRRLFESQGLTVNRLIRTGYGPARLGRGIKSGSYREASADEIARLLDAVQLPPSERLPDRVRQSHRMLSEYAMSKARVPGAEASGGAAAPAAKAGGKGDSKSAKRASRRTELAAGDVRGRASTPSRPARASASRAEPAGASRESPWSKPATTLKEKGWVKASKQERKQVERGEKREAWQAQQAAEASSPPATPPRPAAGGERDAGTEQFKARGFGAPARERGYVERGDGAPRSGRGGVRAAYEGASGTKESGPRGGRSDDGAREASPWQSARAAAPVAKPWSGGTGDGTARSTGGRAGARPAYGAGRDGERPAPRARSGDAARGAGPRSTGGRDDGAPRFEPRPRFERPAATRGDGPARGGDRTGGNGERAAPRPRSDGDGARPAFRPRGEGEGARPAYRGKPTGDGARPAFRSRPEGASERPAYRGKPASAGERPAYRGKPAGGGADARPAFRPRPAGGGGAERPTYQRAPRPGSDAAPRSDRRGPGGGARPGGKVVGQRFAVRDGKAVGPKPKLGLKRKTEPEA